MTDFDLYRPLATTRRSLLLAAAGLVFTAGGATAAPNGGGTITVQVRVIEASNSDVGIDPALRSLARDLQTLPFKSFKLRDAHEKKLRKGEHMSFQFGGSGPSDRRFLELDSRGMKGNKLRFSIAIKALKFATKVSVPDGGTIVVGGPKDGDNVLVFAITAMSSDGNGGRPTLRR